MQRELLMLVVVVAAIVSAILHAIAAVWVLGTNEKHADC